MSRPDGREVVVERKYGHARRVWVFDRGIVSDANLAAVRRRGGQYLVGTRRTQLRAVEQALLDGSWTRVRDEDGRLRLHWQRIEARRQWRDAREGAYLLRTNLEGQHAEDLWTKYIQLTEAEAAFRALKSDLAIRPVFHQRERRVKAQVLIAFLGYALWVTLKHQLRSCGSGLSPSQALAQLATLQSADIVLPTTDGREIRLRRAAQPTPEQQRLLAHLHITVPAHLEWNAECSGDHGAIVALPRCVSTVGPLTVRFG